MNRDIIIVTIFILIFYGSTNFYIGKRIFRWLSLLFPHINRMMYSGIYIFLAGSLIIGYLPVPSGIKGIMSWIGAYWIGMYIYLLMLFLVADLVIFLGLRVKVIPSPMPQTIRFYASLICNFANYRFG